MMVRLSHKKGRNKMDKKVYKAFCNCGWKTADKKTAKEAKDLLGKHKHKVRVIEYTVTKSKYMTTYTGKKIA
jgi:hypothetical protein